jgi:hypothetical protein
LGREEHYRLLAGRLARVPLKPFHRQLRELNSQDTTITVWTYPDSYPEFRQLKEHLYQRGFLSAARPLPHGHPIGGSPHGSKSAAQ